MLSAARAVPSFQLFARPAARKDRRGVENHGVPGGAPFSGQHVLDEGGVFRGGPSGEFFVPPQGQSPVGGGDRLLPNAFGGEEDHPVRPAEGQLVEAPVAGDHHALPPQGPKNLGDQGKEGCVEDPHDLVGEGCGVDQGAEDVEQGPHAEAFPDLRHVPHHGVEVGGEEEDQPRRVEARRRPLRGGGKGRSQGLGHVGAAAPAGDGTVAVFRHGNSPSCRHEGSRGGDVEGPRAVSPGAAVVHQEPGPDRNGPGLPQEHPGRSPDLGRGLAPGPEGGQESRHLDGGNGSFHDQLHGLFHFSVPEAVFFHNP